MRLLTRQRARLLTRACVYAAGAELQLEAVVESSTERRAVVSLAMAAEPSGLLCDAETASRLD